MNNHKQPIFEPPGCGPEELSWNVPEIAPKLLLPGTEERRKSADSGEADLVLQNVVCTSLERSGQWPRHGRNNKREKSGFHQGDMMIGYDILDRMIYCINDYIQYIGYDNMMIG